MRIIDHCAGNPICCFLSVYENIRRVFIKDKECKKESIKEILVMKYFGIGSIFLSTPMFRALRMTFPKAKITFLTFYNNFQICERLQFADRYIFLKKDNLGVFVRDLIKVLFEFRRHKFDIAIDMEFFSKFSTIVTYLSSARIRVGFYVRNEPRTILYTNPIYYNYYKHISEIFLALAQDIGADTEDTKLYKIKIYDSEKDFISQIMQEYKLQNTKIIIVNVNVGELCLERRWPKAHFISLVNSLAEYPGLSFVFIGTEDDYNYVQTIIDSLDKKVRIINLAGKTNLGQLIILFEFSKLFITSDSGPLHLAALTQIKTISFFGPETPVVYGPIGNNHTVFYKGLYCSPCLNVYNVKTAMYGNKRCLEGSNRCMHLIGVEEVLEKTKQLLGINNGQDYISPKDMV
jgi:ADP-heptose:LPS heptosyltransferase